MLKPRFLSLHPALTKADWDSLQAAYTGRSRHYHNLTHLEVMFRGLDNYPGEVNDLATLEFAIFYHDIVYNPLRQDNEHQSGVVAQAVLSSKGIATLKSQKIYDYILATKSHQVAGEQDKDLNLLLDLDLAILGVEPAKYQAYTRQIRQEYWMYPGPFYRAGRRKAMAHFLEQARIFKTAYYYELLEERARENMVAELVTLS